MKKAECGCGKLDIQLFCYKVKIMQNSVYDKM